MRQSGLETHVVMEEARRRHWDSFCAREREKTFVQAVLEMTTVSVPMGKSAISLLSMLMGWTLFWIENFSSEQGASFLLEP